MRKILLAGVLVAGMVIIPAPARAQTTCNGQMVTRQGSAGPDVISGTAGRDVIAGEAGDDVISGLDGDDIICPGPGDDLVAGGAGNDLTVAEAGPDGADQFSGGPGRDRVSYLLRTVGVTVALDNVANDGAPGEGDNSFLDVEDVSGSRGDDQLFGSALPNGLGGGAGNDRIDGAFGGDSIQGGSGNDVLAGQGDNDFVFGDADDDKFLAAAGVDGADVFEGGSGTDTADYSARFVTLVIELDGIANDGSASGEGDNLRLDVENVIGGGKDDTIIAGDFQANSNLLAGGPGRDILDSRDPPFLSADTVDGGPDGAICNVDRDDIKINCDLD